MENKHKVYTQITRELYNQLLNETIIYPKFGINCNACDNKAEKKIIDYLGYNFFFGWEDMTKVESYKGRIKYSNDNNSKYVLLEMEINKNEIVRTNYYNYCDLIFAYDCMQNGENENSPEFLLALEEEFEKGITIDLLTKNVFYDLDKNELIQILFKKLDKNNIVSIKNLDTIQV